MTSIDSVQLAGDAIKEWHSEEYNFESAVLENDRGVDLSNVEISNMPIIYVPATGVATFVDGATDEGSCNGIIAERGKLTLADGATTARKYRVLVRGPAVVLQEGVASSDVEGDAITMATIKTQLEGLSPPVVVRTEGSTLRSEQTT